MLMHPFVVIVILVVIAGLGALVVRRFARRTATLPQEFASTQEMMEWLAGEAVDIAAKNGVTGLDYSPDSIQKVEEVLGKLHEEYKRAHSDAGYNGLASAFGAYLGECIRRTDQGSKWERDHPAMGEKSYPLHWRGGGSFPMAWCYKRITNGPEDNVWHKYAVLKASRDSLAK